jgi:hypothetical protein
LAISCSRSRMTCSFQQKDQIQDIPGSVIDIPFSDTVSICLAEA